MTQMLCGVLYRTDVIYVSRKRHGYLGIAFVMIKKKGNNILVGTKIKGDSIKSLLFIYCFCLFLNTLFKESFV